MVPLRGEPSEKHKGSHKSTITDYNVEEIL